MRLALAILALFAILVPALAAPVHSQSAGYPNTEHFGDMPGRNAEWYKLCLQVKDVKPPQADLPSSKPTGDGAKCNATDLYYDAKGNPKATAEDWAKARECAYGNNNQDILMMLYANGRGVARNLKLAIRHACSLDAAPAEHEGRIHHLSLMLNGKIDETDFDLCDDITSGYMMGYCASIDAGQQDNARSARMTGFEAKLTADQKASYAALKAAHAAFTERVSNDETDMSGSGRAAFTIEAQQAEMDQFAKDLEAMMTGTAWKTKAGDFAAADAELNRVYQRAMKTPDDDMTWGTVTKDGIRNTQRAWLKYRDAWVAFAQKRTPGLDSNSVKAELTRRRIEQLKLWADS